MSIFFNKITVLFKNKNLFFIKYFLVFSIPLIVSLLILFTSSIFTYSQYVEKEISKNTVSMLNQTIENVDFLFHTAESLNLNFSTNPEITNTLKKILIKKEMDYDDFVLLTVIKSFISSSVNSTLYLDSIYIYFDISDENYISTVVNGTVQIKHSLDTSWYLSYKTHDKNEMTWSELRKVKKYEFENESKEVITVYRRLTTGGVIVLNIKSEYIKNQLNKFTIFPKQQLLLLDKNNNLINRNDNENLFSINKNDLERIINNRNQYFKETINRKRYIISKINSEKYDWKFVSIIPEEVLYSGLLNLKIVTIIMVLTSLFLGLVLAYYITIRNYKHIDNIIKIIDSGKDEKCSFEEINVPVKNHYEYIEKRIIASFVEENKLKFQLAEDKYALKAIELKALRAQINPHFLLNTLETINWNIISICKKPTPANMAINCLAGILKYSLDNSKDGTILEEIEHTKNYIEIQMFRYHEKFDVEWKYNEQLTQYKIIKFVFQPLIENCIYHGINEKEGKGYIRIELLKDYSNIRIIISDNGKGIREEKLEEIRRTLKDPPKNFSEHIGLLNTNKRLKLEYGEEYGISITSMFNFGTHIYIDIPAIKK